MDLVSIKILLIMRPRKILKRIKCELMYWNAVQTANKLNRKMGVVYFVMPTESGKLMVMNYDEYVLYRKKGYTDKDLKPKDLFKESVYHTNCKSKAGKQHKHRKFLRWKGF